MQNGTLNASRLTNRIIAFSENPCKANTETMEWTSAKKEDLDAAAVTQSL